MLKSKGKCYVTSLFTLLQTQFLSDFLLVVGGSNLGRSYNVEFILPSIVFVKSPLLPLFSRKFCFDITLSTFHMHFREKFRQFSRSNRDVFTSIFSKRESPSGHLTFLQVPRSINELDLTKFDGNWLDHFSSQDLKIDRRVRDCVWFHVKIR